MFMQHQYRSTSQNDQSPQRNTHTPIPQARRTSHQTNYSVTNSMSQPPASRVTTAPENSRMKLPSYATCLKANIQPKNFKTLRQYYELVARDTQMAALNKKHILRGIEN